MTALTPAPLELAHLAATTAAVDEDRLTGWLQGHLAAGVPWPALLKLVDLWLLSGDGDRDFRDLTKAFESWERQHPTRKASR